MEEERRQKKLANLKKPKKQGWFKPGTEPSASSKVSVSTLSNGSMSGSSNGSRSPCPGPSNGARSRSTLVLAGARSKSTQRLAPDEEELEPSASASDYISDDGSLAMSVSSDDEEPSASSCTHHGSMSTLSHESASSNGSRNPARPGLFAGVRSKSTRMLASARSKSTRSLGQQPEEEVLTMFGHDLSATGVSSLRLAPTSDGMGDGSEESELSIYGHLRRCP